MTMGSLFAGIGGFELGFESTGKFKTLWQVELEDFQRRVLKKNFPDAVRLCDVTKVNSDCLEWVDIITAGFPCQDISTGGRKDGIDGDKSRLFYECVRIFAEMQPRYVVLENVSALCDRGLDAVLLELAKIGFNARWHVIQAAQLGTQHRRSRIFIIGVNRCFAERDEDYGWCCRRCGRAIFEGCQCNHFEWQCTKCGEWTYPFFEEAINGCSFCGERVVAYSGRFGSPAGLAETRWNAKGHTEKPVNDSNGKGGSEGQGEMGRGATVAGIRRSTNGIPDLMDRRWLKVSTLTHQKKDRVNRLTSLGNSIVPQVAKVVAELVIEIEKNYDF